MHMKMRPSKDPLAECENKIAKASEAMATISMIAKYTWCQIMEPYFTTRSHTARSDSAWRFLLQVAPDLKSGEVAVCAAKRERRYNMNGDP
jgi:hypothetical protein